MDAGQRIYVLYSGPFGEQMVNNFARAGFGANIVCIYEFEPEVVEMDHPDDPDVLRKVWEEPSRYIPKNLPPVDCDLLVVLGIHPLLGDIVPPIAQRLKANAVLYPLDDRERIPEGLRTIQDDLNKAEIWNEFPRPFCIIERSENKLIDFFVQSLGRPRFKVKLDEQNKVIREIEVIRDTPCGSGRCVAEKLRHYSYNDLAAFKEQIMKEHNNEGNENYCLASMDPIEPLMQEAGDVLVEAIYEACGFPTVEDNLLSVVEERGKLMVDELKEIFLKEMKLCEAPRTVDRTIDRLVESGNLIMKDESRVALAAA
jgi:hypothetical protein